jgi:hypothetical protein
MRVMLEVLKELLEDYNLVRSQVNYCIGMERHGYQFLQVITVNIFHIAMAYQCGVDACLF